MRDMVFNFAMRRIDNLNRIVCDLMDEAWEHARAGNNDYGKLLVSKAGRYVSKKNKWYRLAFWASDV